MNDLASLVLALHQISMPYDEHSNPYWQTLIGVRLGNFRRIVVGEFYRTYIDKKFPSWKPANNSPSRKLARLEMKLWKCIWDLIQVTNQPASLLVDIVDEAELTLLIGAEPADKKGQKATGQLRKIQSQDRKLEKSINPFQQEATVSFIDLAIEQAGKSNEFRKSFYTPLLEAREAYVQYLITGKARFIDEFGHVERRGRTPKN